MLFSWQRCQRISKNLSKGWIKPFRHTDPLSVALWLKAKCVLVLACDIHRYIEFIHCLQFCLYNKIFHSKKSIFIGCINFDHQWKSHQHRFYFFPSNKIHSNFLLHVYLGKHHSIGIVVNFACHTTQ